MMFLLIQVDARSSSFDHVTVPVPDSAFKFSMMLKDLVELCEKEMRQDDKSTDLLQVPDTADVRVNDISQVLIWTQFHQNDSSPFLVETMEWLSRFWTEDDSVWVFRLLQQPGHLHRHISHGSTRDTVTITLTKEGISRVHNVYRSADYLGVEPLVSALNSFLEICRQRCGFDWEEWQLLISETRELENHVSGNSRVCCQRNELPVVFTAASVHFEMTNGFGGQ